MDPNKMSKYCTCLGCTTLYHGGNEPQHDWEDDFDDYYFSGMTANRPRPEPIRHAKKETKMKTLTRITTKTLIFTGCILLIIWLPQALFNALTTIGQ